MCITDRTGSGRVAILGRAFEQIFGQIVSARENTLGNTNMVATRHMGATGNEAVKIERAKERLRWQDET